MEEVKRKKSNIYGKLAIIILIIISIGSYFLIPSVKTTFDNIVMMFKSGDFTVVGEFIKSYGPYAMAISFYVNDITIYSSTTTCFSYYICQCKFIWVVARCNIIMDKCHGRSGSLFLIARILGRDMAVKLTSKKGIEQVDEFLTRYGKQSILIARLLPFMSFDIVSYAEAAYRYGLYGILYSNWTWSITSNNSIFLCWRNANWWG